MTAINPFLFGDWTTLDTKEWLGMSVLAVVIIVGSLFTAIAYQNGPSSVVATFDYSYLAFSALWGFLVFSEVPGTLTVLGMALIADGWIALNSVVAARPNGHESSPGSEDRASQRQRTHFDIHG